MHKPEWLRVSEAAQALGVSAACVRVWHRNGILPGRRIPNGRGDRRFLRADVLALAHRGEEDGA